MSVCAAYDAVRVRAWGWINLGFSHSFAVKRLLVLLFVVLPLVGACVVAGRGLLALVVLAVGVWPFPFRFTLDERGLCVSWSFLREWIPWSQIVHAELGDDSRRWILGKRRPVLRILRRSAAPATLWGQSQALEELVSEITHRLSALPEGSHVASHDSGATAVSHRR